MNIDKYRVAAKKSEYNIKINLPPNVKNVRLMFKMDVRTFLSQLQNCYSFYILHNRII